MKFIILSDSRSGTTTIRETIKQHPKVNVLGEVFHNNRHKYIGKELTNEEYCDLFFKNYHNWDLLNKSFGFNNPEAWDKIINSTDLSNKNQNYDYALGLTLFKSGLKKPQDLSFLKKHDLKFIFIERKDKRAAAISREVAAQTRIFHDFQKKNNEEPFKVKINEERLKSQIKRREDDHQSCIDFLRHSQVSYIHLVFEDNLFSSDNISKIFNFLEVEDISVKLKGEKLNIKYELIL
ncbi:MAG: hypothetical protein EBY39_10790 [Flavobacteriia bacterium]|nr:hypothetical protein [Flavobacteriia bacterium]